MESLSFFVLANPFRYLVRVPCFRIRGTARLSTPDVFQPFLYYIICTKSWSIPIFITFFNIFIKDLRRYFNSWSIEATLVGDQVPTPHVYPLCYFPNLYIILYEALGVLFLFFESFLIFLFLYFYIFIILYYMRKVQYLFLFSESFLIISFLYGFIILYAVDVLNIPTFAKKKGSYHKQLPVMS